LEPVLLTTFLAVIFYIACLVYPHRPCLWEECSSYLDLFDAQFGIFPLKIILFPLFQISGRLFSDSGPRRSTRLSGDSGANTNVSATMVVGNGTNNSSKYLGGSKLSSMAFRAVTVRKGQSWTNENIDEGNESLLTYINSVKLYYHMRIEKCKNDGSFTDIP
jgi:hypothetical protein